MPSTRKTCKSTKHYINTKEYVNWEVNVDYRIAFLSSWHHSVQCRSANENVKFKNKEQKYKKWKLSHIDEENIEPFKLQQ